MAGNGHGVVAVDINPAKVAIVNAGRSPLAEPGLPELIADAVAAGRLRATTDGADAFRASEVLFVCVGTPGLSPGAPGKALDLSYLVGISEELGRLLGAAADNRWRTVVVRSTVLPGTLDTVVVPALERFSGLRAGRDFGLGYMPEFLREGQGVDDFLHPATVVVGAADDRTRTVLRELNNHNESRSFECDFRTAEAIKFTNNAWHALKVAFANEIGSVSRASGIDGRVVMDILCSDERLNVSRAYLRPGFAFGGSCLPKDVMALTQHAHGVGVHTPVLGSLLPSNVAHIQRAVDIVAGFGKRRVSLLGLTFKPGTDDLRDSALVELAERLIGKGFDLRIFDPSFAMEDIVGRNRQFILQVLPHVGSLLVDSLEQAAAHAETVIVGHRSPHFGALGEHLTDRHNVLDAASGAGHLRGAANYQGICW